MSISYRYFKSIICVLLILFLGSCNSPADSPSETFLFNALTSMPGNGRASAVAFVINDTGYVSLGRNGNFNDSLKECWAYNSTTDTWSQKAPFPGKSRVKAVAAVVNDTAYVGLGFNRYMSALSGGILNDFWMYVPKTNSWTQRADFPSKATDACVSFVFKNCIYVGSGFDGFGFNKEFWKYNPTQNSWIRLNYFAGHERACAIACGDGQHYFFGTGYRTLNENDWWEYFPETDSWFQRKSMPDTGRENAVALTIDNRFFVSTGRCFGGNLTGGHVISGIIEYVLEKDVWYERGNIPNGGRENSICFTINGKGYIGFGENDTNILNDFWSFKP